MLDGSEVIAEWRADDGTYRRVGITAAGVLKYLLIIVVLLGGTAYEYNLELHGRYRHGRLHRSSPALALIVAAFLPITMGVAMYQDWRRKPFDRVRLTADGIRLYEPGNPDPVEFTVSRERPVARWKVVLRPLPHPVVHLQKVTVPAGRATWADVIEVSLPRDLASDQAANLEQLKSALQAYEQQNLALSDQWRAEALESLG